MDTTGMRTEAAPIASQQATTAGVTLPIYLDNHATTPLDPRALEAMLPEAQTMISGIQNRIEERLAAKKSMEDAVSDLLGADH